MRQVYNNNQADLCSKFHYCTVDSIHMTQIQLNADFKVLITYIQMQTKYIIKQIHRPINRQKYKAGKKENHALKHAAEMHTKCFRLACLDNLLKIIRNLLDTSENSEVLVLYL